MSRHVCTYECPFSCTLPGRLLRWLLALARLAWESLVHAAYLIGLRDYCWPCDELRWALTHRHCSRRAHEEGARIATLLAPYVASLRQDDEEDRS